jgi:hypothetical protein
VALDSYVVCRDYWRDAGRLYLASGGTDENALWTLLGSAVFVYPWRSRGSVCLDLPGAGRIDSLPCADLDCMDAVRFARILRRAGYVPEPGRAWYILDYVRIAVEQDVAVTPHGVHPVSRWLNCVFSDMRQLGWLPMPEEARHAFA